MNAFYALRKYGLAVAALSIVAVASMDALAADKKAKAVEDWLIWSEKDKVQSSTVAGLHSNVMSNTKYALKNITKGMYIGSTVFPEKLQWDKEHKPRTNPKPRFEFVRLPKDKTPTPLKFGDTIRIAMPDSILFQGKPAPTYLMYTKQKTGINLGWLQGSSAQWEIQGGPKGEVIKTGAKISLYNLATKDYLIYAEREHGINLRWNGEVNKPRDHRKK